MLDKIQDPLPINSTPLPPKKDTDLASKMGTSSYLVSENLSAFQLKNKQNEAQQFKEILHSNNKKWTNDHSTACTDFKSLG